MATVTSIIGKSILAHDAGETVPSAFYARWGKRLLDILGALAGLLLLAPILAVCALLVRHSSSGPILFKQTRVGRWGKLFTVLKFRTMVEGAEALGAAVVVGDDRRLTPVGQFLRKTKLDELPQLVNILLGQMSLVGPRPRVPSEVEVGHPQERILLSARPGITSAASIHHRREAEYCARQANPQSVHLNQLVPQKRTLDCEYVQNLSLRRDLELLLLTFLLIWTPGKSLTKRLSILGCEVWPYGRGVQMLLDGGICAVAAWLAYHIRYDGGLPEFYRRQMWLFVTLVPVLRVGINRWLGIYDLMWRYVTLDDGSHLAAVLTPVTLMLYGLRLGLRLNSWGQILVHIPLTIITLEYLIALTGSFGLRALRRDLYVLHQHYQPLPKAARRVLILGAGLLGMTTALDLRRCPQLRLVGFLDDDPTKYHRLLAGGRVLGGSTDLEECCLLHAVTDLVICANSLKDKQLLEIRQRCAGLGVSLRVLPGLDRLLEEGARNSLSAQPTMPEFKPQIAVLGQTGGAVVFRNLET